MVDISKEIFETVNKPGRVGVLGTADKQGQPNVAYFGSLRLMEDGTVVLGLGKNRSLANLEGNPLAVLFCVAESPVGFKTPGCRLYLKVREIQKKGALYDNIKAAIAQHAGAQAAAMIVAAVAFDVTEVRPLMVWPG
ncbi:MAG: pyridoxamine 5'-phosphate oxidase family protein [Deltaproteobacteria bacterium]|nr:pyridoxamine 5'-phosphate oxidase family protein [Deltaproteobacteria bacterium]